MSEVLKVLRKKQTVTAREQKLSLRYREVTMELLEKYGKEFVQDRANRVAQNAVVGKGVNAAATDSSVEREIANTFSISLEQGKITNQKKSGRCWMFAALNCMRFQVMKHCNLETFELSQNYTLFYDKLEKSNYFLNTILDTLEEDTDSRLIAHLLSAPLNDGGQWDMLCAIVDKYGLVPKEAMPESEISSNTNEMVSYMTEKLREFACTLREAYRAGSTKEELLAKKEEMMQVVYNMLCICLGNPPKTFDFEYRDKDKQFHRECGLTPKKFYAKYIGLNLNDYISLINAPTADKPYYRSYTVQYLGNVAEGRQVRYVNLPIEELKKVARLAERYDLPMTVHPRACSAVSMTYFFCAEECLGLSTKVAYPVGIILAAAFLGIFIRATKKPMKA